MTRRDALAAAVLISVALLAACTRRGDEPATAPTGQPDATQALAPAGPGTPAPSGRAWASVGAVDALFWFPVDLPRFLAWNLPATADGALEYAWLVVVALDGEDVEVGVTHSKRSGARPVDSDVPSLIHQAEAEAWVVQPSGAERTELFLTAFGAEMYEDGILITVADARFVGRLREERPATATFRVGGAAMEASETRVDVVYEPPPPAAARVELVDGLPVGAVGPLLVYTREVGDTDRIGRSWPKLEIVTYDLGAGAEVASFEVGGVGSHASQVLLAGREIVVGLEHTLNAYALNGALMRTLREAWPDGRCCDGRLSGMAVSPDGTKLAVSERPVGADRFDRQIVFLDVATGDELLVVPSDHEGFEGISDLIEPSVWRDDGLGVVVRVITSLEGGARLATVMLDGTVRPHETAGNVYPAASGRRAAHGPGSLGCMFISGHTVTLTDLDSGAVLATIEDDTLSFLPWEWSPDSSELVYAARPFPSDPEEVEACEWPFAEPQWFLLGVDGGLPQPIGGPLEARARWYGEHSVTFRCEGTEAPGWYGRFTLTLRSPDECLRGSDPAAEIIVGGEAIGSGRALRVLGFIDVPVAAMPAAPYAVTFARGETIDVSPAVVFVNAERGEATAWVFPLAASTLPEFDVAPSGEYIVWRDVTADGTEFHLLRTDDGTDRAVDARTAPIEFGPDGTGFIAARSDSVLSAYDGGGSQIRDLWSDADIEGAVAAWSPDGVAVAVAGYPGGGWMLRLSVWPDVRSGAPIDAPETGRLYGRPRLSLEWSPNSSKVALVSAEGVAIFSRDGDPLWAVDGQLLGHLTSDPAAANPRWSPDGRFLYIYATVSVLDEDDRDTGATAVSYLLSSEGEVLFRVVSAGTCFTDPWLEDGVTFRVGGFGIDAVDATASGRLSLTGGTPPPFDAIGLAATGFDLAAGLYAHFAHYGAADATFRTDDGRYVVTTMSDDVGHGGCGLIVSTPDPPPVEAQWPPFDELRVGRLAATAALREVPDVAR